MKAASAWVALMLSATASDVLADPLESLRWSHRVLLAFAPTAEDPRTQYLSSQLAARRCEADERDLVLVTAPLSGGGALNGSPLATSQATALRRRHVVGASEFAVVLVGKDGGEKLRAADVPDLDEVFALIDGMPMRRAEMRRRPWSCPTGRGGG